MGNCFCQVQWNGNSECGVCVKGYIGIDCSIMEFIILLDDIYFYGCYINYKSEFWNFINVGYGFFNREFGIYRFIYMGEI